MPQYSSTATSTAGYVVNVVLNTETNLQIITITAPNGRTATLDQPGNLTRASSATVNSLTDNLIQAGNFNANVTDIGSAIRVASTNVVQQAQKAGAEATATNTPVPESPQPPTPTSNSTDPAVPAAAAAATAVTNTTSQPATVPATIPASGAEGGGDELGGATPVASPQQVPADEFGDLDAAIERQQASEPVLSEDGEAATGVRRNTETGEVFYTDAPKGDDLPFDEFAGVDEAVAEQKRIATNTSGLPVLAEDGSVAEGVAINPETGETYFTVPTSGARGLAATQNARQQATKQDQANFELKKDWRVRLSLTPGANYLYKADPPGILAPLAATDGIIFPYTPNIQVNYAANYEPTDVTHTNYKVYQYKNSNVDNITITCDFTAQDTYEANYLLAVIHFFRSVTKMFYGQDNGPTPANGTPPPLCYLYGLGAFQFEAHPLAITNFTYNLPVEVDYIRATTNETTPAGVNKSQSNVPNNSYSPSSVRLQGTNASPGAVTNPPQFAQQTGGTVSPTYVPTKMQISISAVPIISRNNISNYFSLKEYATGKLLRGVQSKRGGIW